MLQPHIFKAYDVRGVFDRDWDATGAAAVARAFAQHFHLCTVVLGWDMRVSSDEMVAAIEQALIASGVRVISVGRVTTPILYFATAHYGDRDGGIMVTASHNTGEWNGMKFCLSDGMPVGESNGLKEVATLALRGEFVDVGGGMAQHQEVIEDARATVVRAGTLTGTSISVVIDCGNGMEGATIHKLLARVPQIQAHVLYDTPDGSFPHHEANPLKEETLADLKREVVSFGAALGVAFDGDGDRIGFVDEQGAMVSGDVMTALIAAQLLKKNPNAPVLYDLRSRRAVARAITEAGGVAVMSRVGHAFIKKQMREVGALFAGELSSHFYFRDFYSVECADLMMLLVVRLLQETGQPLSALAAPLLSDAHSGEINFHVADRGAALAALEAAFAGQSHEVLKLDGVSFDMGDWWFNVRSSNTEPLLRLNMEAPTRAELETHVAEVKKILGV